MTKTKVSAQWETMGDAAIYSENQGGYKAGKELIVTKDQRDQRSAVWKADKMNMFRNFEMRLKAYFGNKDSGADGMALVLHNDVRGTAAEGDNNQGGSAMGASNISHSVIIEFDTYQNGEIGDPAGDHVAFYKNGRFEVVNRLGNNTEITIGTNTPNDIEDGTWYDIHLIWNYNDRLLSVNMMNELGDFQTFSYTFQEDENIIEEIKLIEEYLNEVDPSIIDQTSALNVLNNLDRELATEYDREYIENSQNRRNYWINSKDIFFRELVDTKDDGFLDSFHSNVENIDVNYQYYVDFGFFGWWANSSDSFSKTRLINDISKVEKYAILDYYLREIESLNNQLGNNSIEDIFTRSGEIWNGEIVAGFTASTGGSTNEHKFKELQVDYSDLSIKLDGSGINDFYNSFTQPQFEVAISNSSKIIYDPEFQALKGAYLEISKPIRDADGKLLEELVFNGDQSKFDFVFDNVNGTLELNAKTDISLQELESAIDDIRYKSIESTLSPDIREISVTIKGEIIEEVDDFEIGDIIYSPASFAKINTPFINLNGLGVTENDYSEVAKSAVPLGSSDLYINIFDGLDIESITIETLNYKTGDSFSVSNYSGRNRITRTNSSSSLTFSNKGTASKQDFENALKAVTHNIEYSISEDRELKTSMLLSNGAEIKYTYSRYYFHRLDLDDSSIGNDYQTQIDFISEQLAISNNTSLTPESTPIQSINLQLSHVFDIGYERLFIDGEDDQKLSGDLIGGHIQYLFNSDFTKITLSSITNTSWANFKGAIEKIKYSNSFANPTGNDREIGVQIDFGGGLLTSAKTIVSIGFPKVRLTSTSDIWQYDTFTSIDINDEGYQYDNPIGLFLHTPLQLGFYQNYGTNISMKSVLVYTGKLNEKDSLNIDGTVLDIYVDKSNTDSYDNSLKYLIGNEVKVHEITTNSSNLVAIEYEKGFEIGFKDGSSIQNASELFDLLSKIKLTLAEERDEIYLEAARQLWVEVQGQMPGASYDVSSNVLISSYEFLNYESILPVTLGFFGAKRKGHNVEVSWTTFSEFNNDYFELQRSIDGVNYSMLNKQDGQIESNVILEYHYDDIKPPRSTIYYRLKQVDMSKDYKYYYTSVGASFDTSFEVELLSENPVRNNQVILGIHSSVPQESSISIYDMNGKLVFLRDVFLEKGTNQEKIDLNIGSSGLYILNVQTQNGNKSSIKLQINP
ncbi:lectin-like domain-containing protein [Sediminitomix flava]|nr:T9SS type A sorting domain-containing protein [Sediminitomix flava]